jgi:hypothetical protein
MDLFTSANPKEEREGHSTEDKMDQGREKVVD